MLLNVHLSARIVTFTHTLLIQIIISYKLKLRNYRKEILNSVKSKKKCGANSSFFGHL